MSVRTVGNDSFLGCWTYSEWRPPHLAGFVELLWHSDGWATTYPRKRVFPNGRVELVINLGEPLRLVEGAGAELFEEGCLSGVQPGPIVIELPPRQTVMAVRLRPAGAYALLGAPLAELSGFTVDLGAIVGRAAEELVERCREASAVEERFRIAVDWVWERIRRSPGVEPPIAWIASRIEETHGTVRIGELREDTGLSKTRLARAFREQTGIGPKLYARVFRFRRAVGLLHTRPAPLVDLALDAGYYDQPHMNAEFRELGGLTPGEFVAAPRYAQTLSVAEPA